MRSMPLLASVALAVAFLAGNAMSGDETRRPPEETMKALERYGTPGPEHAALKPLAGSFEARVKASFDPSQPAKETTGRSTNEVLFGGLFLKQEFEGTCPMTGKPFQGVGYLGFDNARKKYVATWLDSLSSGIFASAGAADAGGRVFTFNGTCPDPVTGAEKKTKCVFTIVDENRHVYECFELEGGKERRVLEITYTKK